MNEETKLPEGLELAETLCGHAFCADACMEDQMRAAIDAIRTEHAQRLTLQHRAADLAQRVADLENRRDTHKAAWAGYHPLAEYMQGLADGGNLPGAIGQHFGDIAIKRMKGHDARITDLEAERDAAQQARRDAQALAERYQAERNAAGVQARREVSEHVRKLTAERDELRARLTGSTAKQLAGDCAVSIRALPLPESTVEVVMDREHGGLTFAPAKREPVRLTDGKGECDDAGHEEGRCGNASCCGQPAVLAANGLTK